MSEVSTPEGRLVFKKKGTFVWKTVLLTLTTLALIPILLYQNETGAKLYLWFLLIVHVFGLFVFMAGVKKEDIAPSRRGFYGRLAGMVSLLVLLWLASDGVKAEFGSGLFWGSLFAIWALHTAGLLMLHIRGRKETACPFA